MRSCRIRLLTPCAPAASASGADSEHPFGFTEGADIGKANGREAERSTVGFSAIDRTPRSTDAELGSTALS